MKYLIAEDDPDFAELLKARLRLLDVKAVATMRELFRLLESGARPEVILLDLKLLDSAIEESLGVIHHIKVLAPDAMLVVVTGDAREETRDTALIRGADRFIEKDIKGGFRAIADICSSLIRRDSCACRQTVEAIEIGVAKMTRLPFAPPLIGPVEFLL